MKRPPMPLVLLVGAASVPAQALAQVGPPTQSADGPAEMTLARGEQPHALGMA